MRSPGRSATAGAIVVAGATADSRGAGAVVDDAVEFSGSAGTDEILPEDGSATEVN
jgi:hypothetical protein